MLSSLSIRNFTIVSKLDIDFCEGMTTFTGETGAGKSIMLDALSLILGQRADPGVVREGASHCELSAVFTIGKNPDVKDWLAQQSMDVSEDCELILRRVIHTNGRSKAFINASLYPLQKIKELGLLLLHIHGQNEQYHLLKADVHREQLDAFALNEALRTKVKLAYQAWFNNQKQIKELEQLVQQDADHQALLSYQLEELDELELMEGEVQSLGQEHKRLSQANRLIQDSEQIIQTLDAEQEPGMIDKLNQIPQIITALDIEDSRLTNAVELINTAGIQLEEALNELQSFQQSIEVNPERLLEVEGRIARIFDLARKHRIKPENLLEHHHNLIAQQKTHSENAIRLKELYAEQEQADQQLLKASKTLSLKRVKEAKVLAKKITQLIADLGIPDGKVEVKVSPNDRPAIHGMDDVEYLVRLNLGSSFKPLAKIASGGELARISLAIQVLTAEKKAYPTLMFDEVDTGIGGVIAAKVGQLLRGLGQHTQVFCVTHQAQVASNANWHMKVEKQTVKGHTYSLVKQLAGEQKVAELARMISGTELTEQTLAHAKDLLAQSC